MFYCLVIKEITQVSVAMRPGETPVPIPNTMVKTRAADGTMLETAWESRWPPNIIKNNAQAAMCGKKCIPAMDDCMGQSGSRRSRYLENCILKRKHREHPGDPGWPRMTGTMPSDIQRYTIVYRKKVNS